jgi:protein-S-isoprenylcysteine O-methyltransferase Ste14
VASFAGFVAFVVGLLPGRTVDLGPHLPPQRALVVDVLLLLGLSAPRSLMALPAFERWWARFVPAVAERSTCVLASSVLLAALVFGWRPLPEPVWTVESRPLVAAIAGLCAFGWLLAVWASFMIDHRDLFGVRQVTLFWANHEYRPVPFQVGGAYRFVRHPMLLGTLLGLWAAPRMTLGHLLLAAGFTVVIAAASAFEERSLAAELGEPYRRYLARVPGFVPRLRPRRRGGLRRAR